MNSKIRNNRMVEVTLTILKADNTPLENQEVTIEQTDHKFLFGTAAFDLVPLTNDDYEGEEKERAEERAAKISALFNAATLPFYWARFEPEHGKPITEKIKNAARWCLDHNMLTKGHPLCCRLYLVAIFFADPSTRPRWVSLVEIIRLCSGHRSDDGRASGGNIPALLFWVSSAVELLASSCFEKRLETGRFLKAGSSARLCSGAVFLPGYAYFLALGAAESGFESFDRSQRNKPVRISPPSPVQWAIYHGHRTSLELPDHLFRGFVARNFIAIVSGRGNLGFCSPP